MRTIDDYFSKDVDRDLYHYTGIGALVGMVNSENLWASNAYFMNDSKEIVHACDVLKDTIRPRLVFSPEDEIEFLKQFLTWIDACRVTTYNIFVFSLSEESSLLSQWRSYTPHGKGVSLEFNPAVLGRIIGRCNLRIAKCIYARSEQEELLLSLIEKLLITFRKSRQDIDISKCPPNQCYHPFLEQFRGDVLQVLSIIKHSAFSEEREWRLISEYYPRHDTPAIKFREGASMLVPYIELPLCDQKPYFERIILGPSPHQKLSMSALSMFLSNKNVCNQTTNSCIPYREW